MQKICSLVLLLVISTSNMVLAVELSTSSPKRPAASVSINPNKFLSFDLDETLVESNHLGHKELKKARELGYEIKTTVNGQDYIIRPGAIQLLDFAHSQGFEMMILTHNYQKYAQDILESSGLAKYFTNLKAHEDVVKPFNVDFQKYPNHRNRTYPQKSILETYTVDLYQGMLVTTFRRMEGEHNIHSFMPCTNCSKYPPLYGARVHIDNAEQHVEGPPVDFVGILVDDFYADKLEPRNANGDYLWVEKLKADIIYLKQHNWQELYKNKYKKAPVDQKVEIQN